MALSSTELSRLCDVYPFFTAAPAAQMQRVREALHVVHIPAGTTLFDERQACELFPLVLSGRIRVAKFGAGGRRLHLYDVGAGEGCVLTGSCLLSSVSYTAHGETAADTEVVGVPRPLFIELIDSFEPFRRHVFELVAARMAELMALVEEVAFRRLDQRLASRLLGRGARLKTTHQALADELGSVREIVSRVLGQFAEEGLIRLGRQEIEILDAAGLRERAGA